MLSPDFRRFLLPRARTMNLIWGAMLAACLLYVVIAWLMFGQGVGAEREGIPADSGMALTLAMAMAAVGVLFASAVVERIMLSRSKLETMMKAIPSAETAFIGGNPPRTMPTPEQVRLFESLPDHEKRLAGLAGHYQTAHIVIWAMRESVVVFGLVLAILKADFPTILPFAAVGLVALVLKAPRPATFFERQLDMVRRMGAGGIS